MILMAGERIGTEEARDWGLIDRIVPPEAERLCTGALTAEGTHVAAIKRMIRPA